ncbi:hypothetical protein IV203_012833 [Nitzschia inconspicua]|uniref:Uncharacterized protein n=1 Tax=Nitzschia inconspicua TaxID=303405 RepID=A0A9K3Q7F4_9STRA|nr:hypothetical protein IV203_012833 [Nitzschia inconspicua]
MKISIVATVFSLLVLLPAFQTADCDPQLLGLQTCQTVWNLTDFEKLTIAHIPDKIWAPHNETINMTFPNGTSVLLPPPNVNPIQGQLWVPGVSSRTLLVVIYCVILTLARMGGQFGITTGLLLGGRSLSSTDQRIT